MCRFCIKTSSVLPDYALCHVLDEVIVKVICVMLFICTHESTDNENACS